MKAINVGIIGCGRVAKHYSKIFKMIDDNLFSLKAACDLSLNKAIEFASQFDGCAYFDSIDNMLKSKSIDLIIISTESGLHFQHSKIFLENNIHVLVEKPITLIPSEAEELIKIAKQNNLMLCVAFQNRFNNAIIELKKAYDNNKFGKIITCSVRLRWCRYQDYYDDGWHGTWKMDGGVISQQAIHHIDILNWILGPIKKVSSLAKKRSNKLEAEDTLVSIFELENGGLGTIECTTAIRPKDFEASISITGEKGMASVDGIALNKINQWYFYDEKESLNFDKINQEFETGYGLSHKILLEKVFYNLSNNITDSPVSAEESLSTLNLIHSLYSSDEEKEWVSVDEKKQSNKLGK